MPLPLFVRTLPLIPPDCAETVSGEKQAVTSRINGDAEQICLVVIDLTRRLEFFSELGRYIIDDVIERPGWLVADQPFCFFKARDATLHVFKAFAVSFFVRNKLISLLLRVNAIALSASCLDRNFLVVAEIDDLAEACRDIEKF